MPDPFDPDTLRRAARPNVDTYPLASVYAAMRMAVASNDEKPAARQAFASALRDDARELTASITRRIEADAHSRRHATFLRGAGDG